MKRNSTKLLVRLNQSIYPISVKLYQALIQISNFIWRVYIFLSSVIDEKTNCHCDRYEDSKFRGCLPESGSGTSGKPVRAVASSNVPRALNHRISSIVDLFISRAKLLCVLRISLGTATTYWMLHLFIGACTPPDRHDLWLDCITREKILPMNNNNTAPLLKLLTDVREPIGTEFWFFLGKTAAPHSRSSRVSLYNARFSLPPLCTRDFDKIWFAIDWRTGYTGRNDYPILPGMPRAHTGEEKRNYVRRSAYHFIPLVQDESDGWFESLITCLVETSDALTYEEEICRWQVGSVTMQLRAHSLALVTHISCGGWPDYFFLRWSVQHARKCKNRFPMFLKTIDWYEKHCDKSNAVLAGRVGFCQFCPKWSILFEKIGKLFLVVLACCIPF